MSCMHEGWRGLRSLLRGAIGGFLAVVCFWGVPAAAATTEAGGTAAYFPEVLSDAGSGPRSFCGAAVAPEAVVQDAASEPPLPELRTSFLALARAAFLKAWLPDKMEDARYLVAGEGAYRASVGHFYKAYEAKGSRVILKGFPGEARLVIRDVPVKPPAEVEGLLRKAGGDSNPYVPGKAVPPAALDRWLTALRQATFSTAALPEEGANRAALERLYVVGGWVNYSYLSSRFRREAGGGEAAGPTYQYGMDLWTDGVSLWVSVIEQPTADRLGDALSPTPSPVATLGLPIPYVTGVISRQEWVNDRGELVISRAKASHERLYVRLQTGEEFAATVPLPPGGPSLVAGCWLCLGWRTIAAALSNADYYARVGISGKRIVDPAEAKKVAAEMAARRKRCLDVIASYEQAPCPEVLSDTRREVLELLAKVKLGWEVAGKEWEAVGAREIGPVSINAANSRIWRGHEAKGLRGVGWLHDSGQAPLLRAGKALGITVSEHEEGHAG